MIEELHWIESEAQTARIINEKELEHKINELVGVVNGILAAQEQYATIYNEDIVPMLTPVNEEPHISKMETTESEHFADTSKMIKPAENGKCAKNAQDPYAEQRKWIGKLCRFWDDDAFVTSNDWAFGMLTSIDKGMQFQYCCNENCNFKHCEPVSPDDETIFKGE